MDQSLSPPGAAVTSILLVEDHRIVRDGLAALIALESEFRIVGEAGNGLDALVMIAQERPDVALVDLAMPGMDGVELTRRIKARWPDIAVIMLTATTDPIVIRSAVAAGVDCFVRKHEDSGELLEALHQARDGCATLSEDIKRLVRIETPDDRVELTPRERQIATLIGRGMSNEEIGGALHISLGTARKHRENLMRKLKVRNVAELTAYAMQAGLLSEAQS